jgi:hypothetical protein
MLICFLKYKILALVIIHSDAQRGLGVSFSLTGLGDTSGVARNFLRGGGVPASGKMFGPANHFFSPVLPSRYFFSKGIARVPPPGYAPEGHLTG